MTKDLSQLANESDQVYSNSYLYNQGKKLIEKRFNLKLIPDIEQKPTCYHKVLINSKPFPMKGITYPQGFTYYRAITPNEFDDVQSMWVEAIYEIDPDVAEFWSPLFIPKSANATTKLDLYTLQRLQLTSRYEKQFGGATHDLGISFHPQECLDTKTTPQAFIPERDWFDESLHQVTLEDIFTLYDTYEMKMFALCLGRAVVGRTNHIPVGRTEPITHTFRNMLVSYGYEPGQGKSVMMNNFINALRKVGYRVSNFDSLSKQFNLGSVISAHIAYKDDMTSDALKSNLKASNTKQAITNAQIRVENKGVDAIEQWSHALFITNINRYDPNIMYDLDDGIMSRVALLSTRFNVELDEITPTGASEGTPSILPFYHYPYLAEKLGISLDALMLWTLRLCADYFLSLIESEDKSALVKEVKRITTRLRTQFNKDITNCVTSALQLSCLLTSKDLDKVFIPEITPSAIKRGLNDFLFVSADLRCHQLRNLIKEDWNKKGRPEGHPWKAIAKVKKASIDLAWEDYQKQVSTNSKDLDLAVKTAFGRFTLVDGFKVGAGLVYVTSAWEESRKHQEEYKQLVRNIRKEIPNFDELISGEAVKANTKYLYSFDYDAANMAQQMDQLAREKETTN